MNMYSSIVVCLHLNFISEHQSLKMFVHKSHWNNSKWLKLFIYYKCDISSALAEVISNITVTSRESALHDL